MFGSFFSSKSSQSSVATQLDAKNAQKLNINDALIPLQRHMVVGLFQQNRSLSQIIGMQAYYFLI